MKLRTAMLLVMLISAVAVGSSLQRRDISAPQSSSSSNEAARAELQRIITQLRTIRFSEEHSEEPASAEPVQQTKADPNKPADPSLSFKNAAAADLAQALQGITASAAVPAPIAVPLYDPNNMIDIFASAEAFYRAGRIVEAAECYRRHLVELDGQPQADQEERAWALFQLGNCLVRKDPEEALVQYRRLITEHPASQWTPIALTREQLINWRKSAGVDKLGESR